MERDFAHTPVMLEEVLDLFKALPDGLFVDGTVGGAGHAAAILVAHPGLHLVGIDRDETAIVAARRRLAEFGDRAVVHRARFDHLAEVLSLAGLAEVPAIGILLDLGVSSPQIDEADRGFSYQHDGPLDMRMDRSDGRSAFEVVNEWDEQRLAALLSEHGEGRFARRIVRAIINGRPVTTTSQLADLVAAAIPAAARRRGHPARRVFQALRVEVNEELIQLGPTLDSAIDRLAPGGRLVVLSYHSGEDRMTKEHFVRAATGGCVCPPGLPCVCGATPTVRLLNRGARMATPEESERNPRAESVRLRAVERLTSAAEGA